MFKAFFLTLRSKTYFFLSLTVHQRILLTLLLAFSLISATLAQNELCRDTAEHTRLRNLMLDACNQDDSSIRETAIAEYQTHAIKENDLDSYYNGWFNNIMYELNRLHIYEAYQLVQAMRNDMENEHKATEERYLVPNMLGQIYNSCGYYNGAMELFKEAIHLIRGTHYEAANLNTIYLGMAHTCMSKSTKESMHWITEYMMEVEKHADSGRYYRNMANAYAFKCILDFKDENFDKFREDCKLSIEMEEKNHSGNSGSFLPYRKIYQRTLEGDMEGAITAAKSLNNRKDRYLVMRDIYHYNKLPMMASKTMQQLTHLRDSITGIMILENIKKTEAEVKMANEHREATDRLNLVLIIAIIITMLFLIAVVANLFIYRRYQKRLLEKNRQLKQATMKAQESDRMKSSFIRNVSHELRTPLNIIYGFSQVLTNTDMPLSDEERHEAAVTIDENTRHITSLVNKMIALADEDATDITGDLHQVNCIDACHQAIIAMPPVDPTQVKVELHTLVPEDFCIQTNVNCLQRMLSCLLENAVKFTEKGKIALTVKQPASDEEGAVQFVVEDTGCGISQGALPHLFTRFVKGDEFKKGLGLGLAYSYETAQKLGGVLEYDATYNNGCRFILKLPKSC